MDERIIEIPFANGMPLERWTAYMYCEVVIRGLKKGDYCLGTKNGMSVIILN